MDNTYAVAKAILSDIRRDAKRMRLKLEDESKAFQIVLVAYRNGSTDDEIHRLVYSNKSLWK